MKSWAVTTALLATALAAAAGCAAQARPDAAKPISRWALPGGLTEISGLALSTDGRLFAHNDESARIFEVDYRRGAIVKEFKLGSPTLRGDFEGLTVANGRFILLASDGTLYEFAEAADGARVSYQSYDTGLGTQCEFEGIAFEAASNSLLLACKIVLKKKLEDQLVIYRWKRGGGGGGGGDSTARTSLLSIPLARVIGTNGWKTLHPSDLTIDPASGNYVLVAAREQALIVLTPAGQLVSARPLPGSHPQAEGVAVTRDHLLLVSDEGGKLPGTLTSYRWP